MASKVCSAVLQSNVDDDTCSSAHSAFVCTSRILMQDIVETQESITDLFQKISDIKAKASQSEKMVQEICADIKKLDYAKNHLQTSITSLNRLQMLINAVAQLEVAAAAAASTHSTHLNHHDNDNSQDLLSVDPSGRAFVPRSSQPAGCREAVHDPLRQVHAHLHHQEHRRACADHSRRVGRPHIYHI